MNITIVIPIKNEVDSIKILYDEILNVMSKIENINYEIFLVDDGSDDGSWDIVENICLKDKKVKGFKFTKNYGKSLALNFCFRKAESDILITMDADLQDDPAEIPNILKSLNDSNSDCVVGWKKTRHDPLTKTIPSKFFNFCNRKLFKINLHDINCGFKAYKKVVYKKLFVYGELHRYIPILVHDQGFKVSEIVINHRKRVHGVSKYGFERFMRGFLDFLTVAFTTKFYQRPNHLFGGFGICSILLGTLIFMYLLVNYFFDQSSIVRPLLFLSISMIIVGIQVLSLGIISEILIKSSNKEKNFNMDIRYTKVN
jgi:glycosyltransferase involved in cell wall biosynthesis